MDVMSESGLRWPRWRLGLCGGAVVLKGGGGGCVSRERERWRGAKCWIRLCWGECVAGAFKGWRGGVERKLQVADGGNLADGSIR